MKSKSYLIVIETKDALGVGQLSVVQEFATRPEAVRYAKESLPEGTGYSLLSVLRGNFTVRSSERVVNRVVDWGETNQPRTRKAKLTQSVEVIQ